MVLRIKEEIRKINRIMAGVSVASAAAGALGGYAWEKHTGKTPDVRAVKSALDNKYST